MSPWRAGVAALGMLLAACGAGAAERWRLATVELPPAVSEHLPQQGFHAVLVRRVLQELGVEAELVFLPGQRVHEELRAGRVDGAFPYVSTPEREREFLLSEPFYVAPVRVFVGDAAALPPAIEGLRGQTGCALRGAESPARLQAELQSGRLRLERADELIGCFRMLQAGRVRFVVAGEHSALAAAAQLRVEGLRLRMANFVVAEQGIHLALPRRLAQSEARLRAFNQALRKLRAAGVMRALERQHLPAELRLPAAR